MTILDSELMAFVKENDATALRVLGKRKFPAAGDLVGVRLNLNILKNTGVAVQTIHSATNTKGYTKNKGFYRGEALGYAKSVCLKNAYFNVDQIARDKIVRGISNKFAMASVDGELISCDTEHPLGGVEIRFNPNDVHLFVDMQNQPIRYAQIVIVSAFRAYAHGEIEYYTKKTAPQKVGTAVSTVTYARQKEWETTLESMTANRTLDW